MEDLESIQSFEDILGLDICTKASANGTEFQPSEIIVHEHLCKRELEVFDDFKAGAVIADQAAMVEGTNTLTCVALKMDENGEMPATVHAPGSKENLSPYQLNSGETEMRYA